MQKIYTPLDFKNRTVCRDLSKELGLDNPIGQNKLADMVEKLNKHVAESGETLNDKPSDDIKNIQTQGTETQNNGVNTTGEIDPPIETHNIVLNDKLPESASIVGPKEEVTNDTPTNKLMTFLDSDSFKSLMLVKMNAEPEFKQFMQKTINDIDRQKAKTKRLRSKTKVVKSPGNLMKTLANKKKSGKKPVKKTGSNFINTMRLK